MREFRIKVNNEKTYVVKANDYNQAVKTLHSKLRDFDDTKKNINVVREFITNNGGKFSESKDADAILDFIYKKTGVKNADYGDVLYIIRNYTNVKVEDNTVTDFDLTNFLALKRSLELRIGEEIDFDKLEEYVNKLPKDKNGKKNINVKEVIKCCIKSKDNAVSDSISRYTGEFAQEINDNNLGNNFIEEGCQVCATTLCAMEQIFNNSTKVMDKKFVIKKNDKKYVVYATDAETAKQKLEVKINPDRIVEVADAWNFHLDRYDRQLSRLNDAIQLLEGVDGYSKIYNSVQNLWKVLKKEIQSDDKLSDDEKQGLFRKYNL